MCSMRLTLYKLSRTPFAEMDLIPRLGIFFERRIQSIGKFDRGIQVTGQWGGVSCDCPVPHIVTYDIDWFLYSFSVFEAFSMYSPLKNSLSMRVIPASLVS